jgi:hypothetical protein
MNSGTHKSKIQTWGIGLLLLTSLVALTTSAAADCLEYGPSVVQISGTLTQKTYPGPPNYADIKKGDRPETQWIVVFPQSICVRQDPKDPDLNSAESGILKVQLVFLEPGGYEKYKGLVGKHVVARHSVSRDYRPSSDGGFADRKSPE